LETRVADRSARLTPVFTAFIPAVRAVGFTDNDINTLFVKNPANAFSIAVRRTRP
jgi:predicted metal-dependent phosphotriesterase family hydrolase